MDKARTRVRGNAALRNELRWREDTLPRWAGSQLRYNDRPATPEAVTMKEGLMMDYPLTVTHFLERAQRFFPGSEVVSRLPDGSIHRQSYAELGRRAAQLGGVLAALGVQHGDRVATLCWNHYRHLELYLAAPCYGAVLHTLNLRLHPNELAYIARHAEDSVVFCDRSLLPLLEKFLPEVPSIRHVVVIADDGPTPAGRDYYEALLGQHPPAYHWPELDEKQAAALCYTSGTTGNPKGVLYSHRSMVLHTLAACMTDGLGVAESDVVLPVVPMFHANAWGLPYAGVCAGSKIVFPGPRLDARSLLELMVQERVTVAGGVPTIWLPMLALLDEHPGQWDLRSVRSMVIGGSAAPPSLIDGFDKRHGLQVTHAWGMTELSPLGSIARLKRHLAAADDATRLHFRSSQGYAFTFVEQRHTDDRGVALPWDGETMGELEVRGPWVAREYYGGEGKDRFTADGWFKTGDVVTIDAEGYLRITDRSKDVIKSGGEWISTVALENALMSHPSVLEAAVFAAVHPRWAERPVAAVVLKEGKSATEAELVALLEARFARFWLPDKFLFLAQIPRTSTGKFLKTRLRQEYGNVLLEAGPRGG
jgi:fatty-acyl-CoA synthase